MHTLRFDLIHVSTVSRNTWAPQPHMIFTWITNGSSCMASSIHSFRHSSSLTKASSFVYPCKSKGGAFLVWYRFFLVLYRFSLDPTLTMKWLLPALAELMHSPHDVSAQDRVAKLELFEWRRALLSLGGFRSINKRFRRCLICLSFGCNSSCIFVSFFECYWGQEKSEQKEWCDYLLCR